MCGLFQRGQAHPDSDYQIPLNLLIQYIETGVSRTLPWEFFEQIRPAVQPAIAYAVHRYATGPDPFATALLLSWLPPRWVFSASGCCVDEAIRWLNHGWSKAALVLFTGRSGCYLFLNARFASEPGLERFSASGIVLVLVACKENDRRALWSALTVGLVFGFAFYLRFPVALALLGLGLWLIIIERPKIKIFCRYGAGLFARAGNQSSFGPLVLWSMDVYAGELLSR